MNAIKLPVSAYHTRNDLWNVRDSDNTRICRDLLQSEAKEIANAINSHDALVEIVEQLAKAVGKLRREDFPSNEQPLWNELQAAISRKYVRSAS